MTIFDSKKTIYLILFLSLCITIGYNQYNLFLIQKKNPKNELTKGPATVENVTVWDVDNEFYLSPPENFLAGKGWRRGPPIGNGSYFRRVPGYSLIYLFFRLFFDVPLALQFVKLFQIILFTISIIYVHKIMRLLSFSSTLSALIALLYGCIPFFSGFVYFTCTESISPYLGVLYFYFLIKATTIKDTNKKNRAYLMAGLFLGIAILTRPMMGLLALIIPFSIFMEVKRSQSISNYLKNILFIGLIPILLLSTWTLRNYILTKEIVVLEKNTHPESLDREKPEFNGLLHFVKCWGDKSITNFNDYYVPFQSSVLIDGDTSNFYIEKIINVWPASITEQYGKDRLFSILKKHQTALFMQKPYYDKQVAMPSAYFDLELEVERDYEKLISEYKKEHFLDYWLKTPLLNLRSMIFHSNTSNLFLFQKEIMNNGVLYVCKSLLYLFHVLLYFCVLLNLFLLKDQFLRAIFVLAPLINMFFLCFIFRGLEQRYMLPVLPVMLIGLAFPIQYLMSKRRVS